jgi:hypothetical protein
MRIYAMEHAFVRSSHSTDPMKSLYKVVVLGKTLSFDIQKL